MSVMKKAIAAALACLLFGFTYAQVSILEKNHEISRRSKKGYLGAVEEKADGKFDMVYVQPSSKRKVKTETYHFDGEANLLGSDNTDEDIERVRTRYKWFKYKGDRFITNNTSVSANYVGDVVFRRKRITAEWNWWRGGYVRNAQMLDKVKPRTESGRNYKFGGGAYEVERDSTILVMAMDVQASKDNNKMVYDLLRADNQLNISVLKRFELPYAMQMVYAQPLTDDLSEDIPNDDDPRDMVVVFAPIDVGGKLAKNKNPKAFDYLRISPEGIVKEQFSFQAPHPGWRILDAYEKDGAVLLYGLGIGKPDKYSNKSGMGIMIATTSNDASEQAEAKKGSGGMLGGFKAIGNVVSGQNEAGLTQEQLDEMMDMLTFNSFAMVKLQGGAVVMSRLTDLDEMNAKAACPPDMKRPSKFDGKMFKVSGVSFLSDKSLIMSLQDTKRNKSNGGGNNKFLGTLTGTSTTRSADASKILYKDMFLLHFKPDGELVRNYTVALDQKGKKGFFNNSPLTADMIPAESRVYESPDKTKLNWVMHIVKAIGKDVDTDFSTFGNTMTTTTSYSPLFSIEYGTIDLKTNTASDFKTLGEDEKRKFYLYPRNNTLATNDFLYFFSETTRGDKLLISRMSKK